MLRLPIASGSRSVFELFACPEAADSANAMVHAHVLDLVSLLDLLANF